MDNSLSDTLIDTTPASKPVWRRRFRAFRAGMSPDEHQQRSQAIIARAGTVPELAQAQTVHLYWPLLDRREVDTRPLITDLLRRGKTVVLPVVEPAAPPALPRLRHVRFSGEADLRVNRWGVREPSGTETVPVSMLDIVVVPAFGADARGHRIGHGLGYYDVFLQEVDAPALCLLYAPCFVDTLPAEPHDVPVSIIVTEDAIVRPRP